MSYQFKIELSVRAIGYSLIALTGIGIGVMAAHGVLGLVLALVIVVPSVLAIQSLMDWLRGKAGI